MELKHVHREANRAVNCMAELGHSQELGLLISCVPPISLGRILKDDASDVALPRMVL